MKNIPARWIPEFSPQMYVCTVAYMKAKSQYGVLLTPHQAFAHEQEMFANLKQVDKYFKKTGQTPPGMHLGNLYLTSLQFLRSVELKPSYWDGNHMQYDDIRQQLFTRMYLNWKDDSRDWVVLVTPTGHYRGQPIFNAPIPFHKDHLETDLEAFMNYSDYVVDETATHAALYQVTDVSGIPREIVRKLIKI